MTNKLVTCVRDEAAGYEPFGKASGLGYWMNRWPQLEANGHFPPEQRWRPDWHARDGYERSNWVLEVTEAVERESWWREGGHYPHEHEYVADVPGDPSSFHCKLCGVLAILSKAEDPPVWKFSK